MIGFGGRSLHQCESPNEMRILPDGGAGDREVLHRTQRMDAPVCVSGNLPVAEQIVLDARAGHLFTSGHVVRQWFQRELFDADGAVPTSVSSTKSVKLTDRSSSMPHTFVRSQEIGRGLTLVRDVRNTHLHPV